MINDGVSINQKSINNSLAFFTRKFDIGGMTAYISNSTSLWVTYIKKIMKRKDPTLRKTKMGIWEATKTVNHQKNSNPKLCPISLNNDTHGAFQIYGTSMKHRGCVADEPLEQFGWQQEAFSRLNASSFLDPRWRQFSTKRKKQTSKHRCLQCIGKSMPKGSQHYAKIPSPIYVF